MSDDEFSLQAICFRANAKLVQKLNEYADLQKKRRSDVIRSLLDEIVDQKIKEHYQLEVVKRRIKKGI